MHYGYGIIIIIIVAAGLVGVLLGLREVKKRNELQEKGIIIDRSTGLMEAPFYEREEIFTLHGDWATV